MMVGHRSADETAHNALRRLPSPSNAWRHPPKKKLDGHTPQFRNIFCSLLSVLFSTFFMTVEDIEDQKEKKKNNDRREFCGACFIA